MTAVNILIVDDDRELCESMADILQDEGYSVKNTSDSREGEQFINDYVFDAAFLDYKMVRVTGVYLLKLIKKKRPRTKVFIMTGKPFIEQVLEEEKVSHLVEHILKKPFTLNELLRQLTGIAL
jgi:DNA-binding NtrC family response regulator